MLYNIDDMKQKSRQLESLVDEFLCSYRSIAANIDWQGKAREKFNADVEQHLATVKTMMTELSQMPSQSADNMENADREQAAKVQKKFQTLF